MAKDFRCFSRPFGGSARRPVRGARPRAFVRNALRSGADARLMKSTKTRGLERRRAAGERNMRTFVRGGVLTVLSVLLTGVGHATLVGCGGAAADPDPFPASEPRKEGEHEPGDPGDGPRP